MSAAASRGAEQCSTLAGRRRVPWCVLRWGASLAAAALLLEAPIARAAGAQTMGAARTTSMELDRTIRTFLIADVLELQPNGPDNPVRFDGLAWIGGDYRRLFLRAEGEQPTAGGGGELQADALYGRLISPFWSAVAGVRLDTRAGVGGGAGSAGGGRVTRGMLALGLEGLAPYWFELEPTLYVSQQGDVSADLTTSFDLLLTQRLIVQPRLEMNAAVQKVPEFGVGSGLNDVEFGARLRYEIRREFAPYVGVSWVRRTGGTAAMVRAAGEAVGSGAVVAGVRLWR